MKTLLYIGFIFYILYVVNKFLSRFYFNKFTSSQQDLINELLKKQQAQQNQARKREGEISIENLKSNSAKKQNNAEGDYIDYEVVK